MFAMSGVHSGFAFQYEVPETTTIREMVIDTNAHWWAQNLSSVLYKVIKVCGPNNSFLEDSRQIGGGHYQNKCYLIFDAA
jgi:hypothetical protein